MPHMNDGGSKAYVDEFSTAFACFNTVRWSSNSVAPMNSRHGTAIT